MTPSVDDNRKYRCKTCGAIYHMETAFDTARECVTCGDVNYEQIRITLVCDFCSTPDDVAWTYPCEDFVVAGLVPGLPNEVKVGDWAACEACHDLIEAGAWAEVGKRAVDHHVERHPLPAKARSLLTILLRKLHTDFQQHRTGTPYRHDKENPDA